MLSNITSQKTKISVLTSLYNNKDAILFQFVYEITFNLRIISTSDTNPILRLEKDIIKNIKLWIRILMTTLESLRKAFNEKFIKLLVV